MELDKYFFGVRAVALHIVESEKQNIEKSLEILQEAKKEGKRVFICGNGGSAGTAIHMASDLFKMGGLRAISLEDNVPLMTALINDEGWEELYIQQLERLFNPGDILITISVHGGTGVDKAGKWSQNLMKAISYVKKHEGKTIAMTGFDGGEMKKVCDACINVPIESTPLVESFHVLIHHYLTFALYEGDRK